MRLLAQELLVKTGDVDHADWNYRLLLGWIQRLRFGLVKSLLSDIKCQRILEVGYGSGIFMPELKSHCEELFGVDVHDKLDEVQSALSRMGVSANLYSGGVEHTIFADNYFDCVVAVSALEFVYDITAACREIRRILKPDGFLIVVTPGYSKILDMGLKILTGENARRDFEGRRELLLPALLEGFSVSAALVQPPILGRYVQLYNALKLNPMHV